jgi:cyclic beta-1,2-glucan synthetase
MTVPIITTPQASIAGIPETLEQWRAAGAKLGRLHGGEKLEPTKLPRLNRRRRLQTLIAQAAAGNVSANADWLLDNYRLVLGAEADTRDFYRSMRSLPAVADSTGERKPRPCVLAHAYLSRAGYRFRDSEFIAFIEGYQQTRPLHMDEIWGLQPALQLELIDELTDANAPAWPDVVTSLRSLGEIAWSEVFETLSRVHQILARDPAGAYLRMDLDGRDGYRQVIGGIARKCSVREWDVAQLAINLCQPLRGAASGSRAAFRRTHVGYYLVDKGRERLETILDYRPPFREQLPRLILKHPTVFYLTAIVLFTAAIVLGAIAGLHPALPLLAALLLVLPASRAATDLLNHLASFLMSPKILPKLDFSEGIPDDCATMVAVPTLLLNESQVRDLVGSLEVRYLGNATRNLHFALLTDLPDSDRQQDQRDALVQLAARLIRELNERYRQQGRTPFFLFHRHRAYNRTEGCWMGWERKRGKLLDFNQLTRGGFDAFPVKIGDLSVLRQIKYVITLDSDTELPRESAARLIGAIAHPLNQAVVHPVTRMVVEGYGILQPRVGVSVKAASRSKLAALYSGQTGFDLYTRAVSNVYQDLFGEGIFTGKGIYEIDTLRDVLEQRFPENALLSHDLIEGAYARAGLVSDIELIDDYPSHFSAYSRRKHRWMRGDWQIMRWIFSKVPDRSRRLIANPITAISRWKIMDNLRRSLLEPAMVVLLLAAWLGLPGKASHWTAAALLIWCIPAFFGFFFALLRVPLRWKKLRAWALDTAGGLREAVLLTLSSLVFLLHEALVSVDAVARTVARVWVTKKKLLEWETAEEAEAASSRATVDVILTWTAWIALGLTAGIAILRPRALLFALPLLVLWMASRTIAGWLSGRRGEGGAQLREPEVALLRDSAARICEFFDDWSSPSTNWLVPDTVREDGTADPRLSPTNLAMLLNARVAAVQLGIMSVADFAFKTRQTLRTVLKLAKFRGHLFNWYDITTLEPLNPSFVSTVDSGNLAASLWTLKEAALAMASSPAPEEQEGAEDHGQELRVIAGTCERLVQDMDFRFLYRPRQKALAIGYDVAARRLDISNYNLLASEARIAAFIAVAKGDIPQEAWLRLGRAHTQFRGKHVLLSWSGTMFEYLMPALWMHHYPDTIIDRNMKAAVQAQRDFVRIYDVPWGISESASPAESGKKWGYHAFGIPELATQRKGLKALVISPYSSFLAAAVDPVAAVANLRRMRDSGWFGRYGFYEAIDYTRGKGEPARIWMAHHQGMSLLAVVNLLLDRPFPRYFHAEPQVRATERLLHERVPAGTLTCEPLLPQELMAKA